jgi:hypothetical protein
MAKSASKTYETHCSPSKISAISRCAIKVKDNFYTIECSEERTINSTDGIDMQAEFQMLFDELNTVTDKQCQEIIDTFK